MRRDSLRPASAMLFMILSLSVGGCGQEENKTSPPSAQSRPRIENARPVRERVAESIRLGTTWLASRQGEDGYWRDPAGKESIGLTAYCAIMLSRAAKSGLASRYDEHLRKACALFLPYCSGGKLTMDKKWFYTGYEIPLVLWALWEADSKRYAKEIDTLWSALKDGQIVSTDRSPQHRRPWHDGAWDYSVPLGIGPDISVVSFAMESIRTVKPDGYESVLQRALPYVQRCQNLQAINRMENSLNDGGFKHEPFAGKAGSVTLAGDIYAFYSYGSVTCDGMRCYLYSGAKLDDRRIVAAASWLKEHYTLDENPNVALSNRESAEYRKTCVLYYYYSMAKCIQLKAIPEPFAVGGVDRRPATELMEKILFIQGVEGSWVNGSGMMWEDHPPLATCLMLDALLSLRNEN